MSVATEDEFELAVERYSGLRMREYLIARMYEDARVQRIYGGANEVMKGIIAKAL